MHAAESGPYIYGFYYNCFNSNIQYAGQRNMGQGGRKHSEIPWTQGKNCRNLAPHGMPVIEQWVELCYNAHKPAVIPGCCTAQNTCGAGHEKNAAREVFLPYCRVSLKRGTRTGGQNEYG
jgi:hypothetical protein